MQMLGNYPFSLIRPVLILFLWLDSSSHSQETGVPLSFAEEAIPLTWLKQTA